MQQPQTIVNQQQLPMQNTIDQYPLMSNVIYQQPMQNMVYQQPSTQTVTYHEPIQNMIKSQQPLSNMGYPQQPPLLYQQPSSISYYEQRPTQQLLHRSNQDDIKQNYDNNNNNNNNDQPLNDAKPSILSPKNFNKDTAINDAKELRIAMRTTPCDKDRIVNIIGSRTHQQRLLIKNIYNEIEKSDLVKDLESKLTGEFQVLATALFMESGEFDALTVKQAVDGLRYNRDLLIELLFTRTNKQLNEMQIAWKQCLNVNRDMYARVQDETRKLLSGNHFQTLCLNTLRLKRANNEPNGFINKQQVDTDAEELYRMFESGKEKDAKTRYIEILGERSWKHVELIAEKFETISQKYTLEVAIKQRFGENTDTAHALCTIVQFSRQPYDYWAKKLREAMKGLGTDNSSLIRIIISRSEIDLHNIREVFGLRYGDGKTLKSWIEDDTSGPYRRLLYKLCGY